MSYSGVRGISARGCGLRHEAMAPHGVDFVEGMPVVIDPCGTGFLWSRLSSRPNKPDVRRDTTHLIRVARSGAAEFWFPGTALPIDGNRHIPTMQLLGFWLFSWGTSGSRTHSR